MSHQGQMSQVDKTQNEKTDDDDQILDDTEMPTGGQVLDSSEMTDNDDPTYDWENSEILQAVKAFSISDYGTKSYDSQISDDEFMVPDPSISGIDSRPSTKDFEIPRPRQSISDVEENYVDGMSSLSHVSDITISKAPGKQEYGKERVETNIFDKLYNAALKGELSIVKDIVENNNTTLMQDENGQTSLYVACFGNELETVKLLVDHGYDVNHQDNEGKTVLHIAFENHAPDLAQTLITRLSANTEIRDEKNWTPLHTAIDRGYSTYSQQLLEKFLQDDAGTEVSWIQLHAACWEENKQHIKFLLDVNTDVNHVSSVGYTPLHIAVTKSNMDLVTLLLGKDANLHSVTTYGKTPLHIAADKGDEGIIEKLLAHNADPSLQDAPGNTSLHLAVQLKQKTRSELVKGGDSNMSIFPASYQACSVQTLQAIIDHGADVNAVNNRGQTALQLACIEGQNNFVKILLDAGTDPNITDTLGDSCIHAVIHGHCSTATIHRIIDRCADINAMSKDGTTPLLLACSTGLSDAVKLLLKAKADPNIAYATGDASLHTAISAGCSKEVIQEIIDSGGKVNAVNKRGRTALLLGCFYRQMDSVKVLLEAGADPGIVDEESFSCVHAAIDGRCSKDTLQALVSAYIDGRRKDGTNALLSACRTGQSESVIFLLKAGANVNITNADGNTCLHAAVHGNCSKALLQNIIEQGLNVNIVNKREETALRLACASAQAESVHLLLEKGANPNISDGDGFTSLHAAIYGYCSNETLQEIISHNAHLDAQNTNGETALWLACAYRQQDSIRILLDAGCNTNITNNNGETSLYAALFGNCSKPIVQAIIDHGAVVNAANKHNETPLMIAFGRGKIDFINVLLRAGANPNNIDAVGNACLHHAVGGDCSKEVLQAIINHGADVNTQNKDNVTALMITCRKGNMDAINALLKAGADPSIIDANGASCLHHASDGDCRKEVLQTLIDCGVDVNIKSKKNETVLMIACQKGNTDAIDALLNAGADPKSIDANGASCLHYASDGDCRKEVLQKLIDCGADVNIKSKENRTALMIACLNGNIDAINVLLNAKADTNIFDSNGNTWLHWAIFGDCSKEVLQAIINRGANVNATGKDNPTALMGACQRGNIDAIDILLHAGADPNFVAADGRTLLHHAVEGDHSKEVLQVLISHRADVNASSKNCGTALMLACFKSNIDAINVLLSAGANPNIVDANGCTCLHYAAIGDCSKEVLHSIIKHGTSVNAKNKSNKTALNIACLKNNIDAINVLLNSGAEPDIANALAPLWIRSTANGDCSKEIFQAMINHGADVNTTAPRSNMTALMTACYKGNLDAIKLLLHAGSDPNITDGRGDTWLHYAADGDCSKEVLQAIIDLGADVNASSKYNRTALMTTCCKSNTDAIYVLLHAGADPNIHDADGNTCLHYAAGGYCSKEVLQAIINCGADVNAINANNGTALMKACQKGNKDAIDVLLNNGADSNISDVNGDTWLHHAVGGDCGIDVLRKIISYGADVNAVNKSNETALMKACKKGDMDVINVLLNAGTDPNINDVNGDTWLHHISGGDCSKQVLLAIINYVEDAKAKRKSNKAELISHGAEVNAKNTNNVIALMLACHKGNINAINILLIAEADPNIFNANGGTWLHHAAAGDYSKEVLLHSIIKHVAAVSVKNTSNETTLMTAFLKENGNDINVLINAGVDPNIVDASGHTWLHASTDGDCGKEVLQAIMSHGVDVNAKTKDSKTALMLACRKGNIDAINILLNAGADPNIIDASGHTCLHHAVAGVCSKEVLLTIINYGADVNMKSKNNTTALMVASERGNIEAITLLILARADTTIVDDYGHTWLQHARHCWKEALKAALSISGNG